MSLLILEDNQEIANLIIETVQMEAIFEEVYYASTISDALAIVNEQDISMFIVDIRLPDGSGHDFIKEVRSFEKHKLTWVIIMTGLEESTESIINNYNSSHCNRYIRKPFTMSFMLDTIKELCEMKLVVTSDANRLCIRRKSVDYFFDHDDIVYVETVEKTAYIYTANKKHRIGRITLNELEGRLDQKKFLRVHRSYIINSDYIDYINKQNNQSQIKIKHYEDFIPVGRTYRSVIGTM